MSTTCCTYEMSNEKKPKVGFLSQEHNLPADLSNYIITSSFHEIDLKLTRSNYVLIHGRKGVGKTSLASQYGHYLHESNYLVRWFLMNSTESIHLNFIDKMLIELDIDTANLSTNLETKLKLIEDKLNNLLIKSKTFCCLFIFDDIQLDQKQQQDSFNLVQLILNFLPQQVHIVLTATTTPTTNLDYFERSMLVELESFNKQDATNLILSSLNNLIDGNQVNFITESLMEQNKGAVNPLLLSHIINIHKFNNGADMLESVNWEESFKTFYDVYHSNKNYRLNIVITLFNLGNHYKLMKDHDKSIDFYTKSIGFMYSNRIHAKLDLFKVYFQELTTKNEKLLALEALNKIGSSYFELKKYSKSLNYFLKALKLDLSILKTHYHMDILNTYINIGNCYIHLRDYAKAIRYYKRSISIHKKLSINGARCSNRYMSHELSNRALNNLAICYRRIGKYKKAIKYFEYSLREKKELIQMNKSLISALSIAKTINNIGICYKCLNQHAIAINYYKKSLKLKYLFLDDNGDLIDNEAVVKSIAFTLNNIGNCYENLNKYTLAKEYYEKSFELLYGLNNGDLTKMELRKSLRNIENCKNHVSSSKK